MLRSLKIPSMAAGAVLVAATVLAGLPSAHAAVITWSASGPSPEDPGNLAAASAIFTTSPGHLQVVLSNDLLISQVSASGQAVSDLIFMLSSDAGTLGTKSASGQLGNVASNPNRGKVTYISGQPTRWIGAGHLSVSGPNITFEVLGGGAPTQLILPFIADGATYTNANNGVPSHNPYVIGPATFELDLSGITTTTTVTAASFSFGTDPELDPLIGKCTVGCETPVPEPASMALLGGALLGFGMLRRRKGA